MCVIGALSSDAIYRRGGESDTRSMSGEQANKGAGFRVTWCSPGRDVIDANKRA